MMEKIQVPSPKHSRQHIQPQWMQHPWESLARSAPATKLNKQTDPQLTQFYSPRSTSHSGEDAPLHSLRGPRTGNIIPNSDRDTGLGRSRLPGLVVGGNWVGISQGLVGPELKLDTDWVSESSSDTKLLQLSSSKTSEATGTFKGHSN